MPADPSSVAALLSNVTGFVARWLPLAAEIEAQAPSARAAGGGGGLHHDLILLAEFTPCGMALMCECGGQLRWGGSDSDDGLTFYRCLSCSRYTSVLITHGHAERPTRQNADTPGGG